MKMWFKNKLHSASANNLNLWKNVQLLTAVVLTVVAFISSVESAFPAEITRNLVNKDSNTLLKTEWVAQFLQNGCSNGTKSDQFCTMYYNMVFNIYNQTDKGDEVKAVIDKAIKEPDTAASADFCDSFPSDVANALTVQPFSENNTITSVEWIKTKALCPSVCLDFESVTKGVSIKVKPVCKAISAGSKWIFAQRNKPVLDISQTTANEAAKTVQKPNTNLKEQEQQLKSQQNNEQQSNLQQASSQQASPPQASSQQLNTKPNGTDAIPNKETSTSNKDIVAAVVPGELQKQVTPKLTKSTAVTATSNDKQQKTVISDDKINKNDNNKEPKDDTAIDGPVLDTSSDEYPEIENNEPNTDDGDNKTNMGDEGENLDIQDDSKVSSSNTQRLTADQPEFRQDKQSNFFPLLMFLMFIVVTFYVAYHNKSKILALLIEGRRRNSSRGGRRKQHSAEYRKLDSNLEEAIQSDGGHVLSTQIIY